MSLKDYEGGNRHRHHLRSATWRLESPVEDDKRPMRQSTSPMRPDQVYLNDWTVERYDQPDAPLFPDTIESLTDAAWEAVAGTLYGTQKLDPNVVSNAMSSTIYGYRPVRQACDVGRIGLEIDGAKFLFPARAESSGTAIRRVALQLGAKLSARPWEGFEREGSASATRPVAIYFNTIKQSLIASHELLILKRNEIEQTGSISRFENITVHCLQHDCLIPPHMHLDRRRKSTLKEDIVDPTQGIVLVVQPTDYNDEFRPPGPAIGTVGALQQLVARAAVNELPSIIMSPRFLADQYHQSNGGWDQSVYQQSSVYGGSEPPKGPTPWLMRDFTPPVFSWVGCALPLSPHHEAGEKRAIFDYGKPCHYSRVVCTQSVMHEGHPWHVFAVKDFDSDTHGSSTTRTAEHHPAYQYLASTKASSGRPPKDILGHIVNEWS